MVWYIILLRVIRTTEKSVFFLKLISTKKYSISFRNKPPPFWLRSNQLGFQRPCKENCAAGKVLPSLVSDVIKMSILPWLMSYFSNSKNNLYNKKGHSILLFFFNCKWHSYELRFVYCNTCSLLFIIKVWKWTEKTRSKCALKQNMNYSKWLSFLVPVKFLSHEWSKESQ